MKSIDRTKSNKEKKNGRCLALFPGAFRPPHLAHFDTVLNLVSRADIDEVVIIITNRCRHIPGTSKALEPNVAKKIWSIYLQDIAKVRVELAPHSAVKHAQSYFERVNDHDTLFFCAGEGELKQGVGRFNKTEALSQKYGVTASVIASSPPPLPGGATAIRSHLAKGCSGYEAFITTLPKHLNPAQCKEVWQICYQGMREMHDIAEDKIREVIERQNIGEIETIQIAKKAKADEVYCVQLTGRRLYIKYANNTVKAAKLGQPLSLKPRARLYVERKALKWLAKQSDCRVELPNIVFFENKSKTLALSEVCPDGHSLEDDLIQGIFDQTTARYASAFLAYCHNTSAYIKPFWGDAGSDLSHWKTLLYLRTVGLHTEKLPGSTIHLLKQLLFHSNKSVQPGFFHLDFCPKNIRIANDKMGVIDFELCSSIGDPAYDFGFLLGHYLFWGIATSSYTGCRQALQSAIQSYRVKIGHLWPKIFPRLVTFSAATIIYCLNRNKQQPHKKTQLLNIAMALLELDTLEDINLVFYRVLNHEFD